MRLSYILLFHGLIKLSFLQTIISHSSKIVQFSCFFYINAQAYPLYCLVKVTLFVKNYANILDKLYKQVLYQRLYFIK